MTHNCPKLDKYLFPGNFWLYFCPRYRGHYGLGGQIIKNAKGHKKLRQRAQNSGKTQDTPEVSTEILLSWQLSSLRWISFDILLTAPSVVVFRSFTDKIKICWSTCTSCTCEIVFPENNILFSLTPPFYQLRPELHTKVMSHNLKSSFMT